MSIALKEAREALYWLRLLDATGTMPKNMAISLEHDADEIVRLLVSITKAIVMTTKNDNNS